MIVAQDRRAEGADGSPPAYEAVPITELDVEKTAPAWDAKEDASEDADLATSRPQRTVRQKTLRFLAGGLAIWLICSSLGYASTSRADRRAVRGYIKGYKSTSTWAGPTEPLRWNNFAKTIYWRLRTSGHRWHRFGLPFAATSGSLSPAEAEDIFLTVPTNDSAQAASHSLTGFSHLSGTEGDRKTSVLVKYQWEQLLNLPTTDEYENVFDAGSKDSKRMLYGGRFGRCGNGKRTGRKSRRGLHGGAAWKPLSPHSPRVWTDRYYPLLSFPQGGSSISLFDSSGSDIVFNATLFEDAISRDPTAVNGSATDPPFHGYSFPGSAEGELLYANKGTKADYEALEKAGISIKGKIVLVRYGGVFRGLKVSGAERYGAAGVIIYTDPEEDGAVTVDEGYAAYPDGPARQPSSLQRGSVQALSIYPGDPLTPGTPAYKDAKRLSRDEKDLNVPRIPSLPLSGKDAKKLLESLKSKGKQDLEDGWKGGFKDTEYWTGPGDKVKIVNNVKEEVTALWNTYALIPGHVPDEVVIIGNHRDAWAFGAGDPNSGTASVNEIVKGLGVLLKRGWQPLRTILIASWDGEELGLIGSTEFAEDYEEWLVQKAVAYLNVDVAAVGSRFDVGASPSLASLLVDVSAKVANPEKEGQSLLDALIAERKTSEEEVAERPQTVVDALGSGSDFTPFLQHVGIASSSVGFTRTRTDPVYHYHSIYDSAYWMDKFGDPGFHRHVTIAKVLGLSALRLADSVVLPINTTTYASSIDSYFSSVKHLVSEAGWDASKLRLARLSCAIHRLQDQATQLHAEAAYLQQRLQCLTPRRDLDECRDFSLRRTMRKARAINRRLAGFERGFIDEKGLQGRPWYRSLVVAPGRWLGYGATPLPGVTEALTIDKCPRKVIKEVNRLAQAIYRTASSLKL